jgi:hypothetical protein
MDESEPTFVSELRVIQLELSSLAVVVISSLCSLVLVRGEKLLFRASCSASRFASRAPLLFAITSQIPDT